MHHPQSRRRPRTAQSSSMRTRPSPRPPPRPPRPLGEVADGLSAAEETARAAAFEAAGKPGLAARSIRLSIAAGAPDDPELRLRQGKLLWEERDFGPARAVLQDAAARLADPARA